MKRLEDTVSTFMVTSEHMSAAPNSPVTSNKSKSSEETETTIEIPQSPNHSSSVIEHHGSETMTLVTNGNDGYKWEKSSSGTARSAMEKMGYRGKGLGRLENGREEAVASHMDTSSTHKTIVISSSITRGINVNGFNKAYRGTAKFERFNGRTADDIKNYIPTHLSRDIYDSAVIAVGGNDLSRASTTIDTVAENVIATGLVCKEFHIKDIYICSVLPRKYNGFDERRTKLNDILRALCKIFGFHFIDNENIKLEEHIDRDGVHLTKRGSSALCRNIVQHLNNAF